VGVLTQVQLLGAPTTFKFERKCWCYK